MSSHPKTELDDVTIRPRIPALKWVHGKEIENIEFLL